MYVPIGYLYYVQCHIVLIVIDGCSPRVINIVCINRLRLHYIQSICGAFAASLQSVVLSCYLHTLWMCILRCPCGTWRASTRSNWQDVASSISWSWSSKCLTSKVMAPNRRLQWRWNDFIRSSTSKEICCDCYPFILQASTRRETKRDDFQATDHWMSRIGY